MKQILRDATAVLAVAGLMVIPSTAPATPQRKAKAVPPPTAARAPAPARSPAPPAAPARPYAMRGVELGITLDAFRAIPVIADDGQTDLQTLCDGDAMPRRASLDDVRSADRADGIISCQWFGSQNSYFSTLFISLGTGKGPPIFDFIDDGGTKRLFRIRVFANSEYASGVLDALTRNYGEPNVTTAPFQTVGGASFTQDRSRWDNGASSITFTQPCRRVQRYCLQYDHARLSTIQGQARKLDADGGF